MSAIMSATHGIHNVQVLERSIGILDSESVVRDGDNPRERRRTKVNVNFPKRVNLNVSNQHLQLARS